MACQIETALYHHLHQYKIDLEKQTLYCGALLLLFLQL